jgi:choline transporter-like protein 2/4/5
MPVIVITVGTYFITTLFFSVYNMAVDTLFLCFRKTNKPLTLTSDLPLISLSLSVEDCERNDGSEEKPYYMPKELMAILGKKNRVPSPRKQIEG